MEKTIRIDLLAPGNSFSPHLPPPEGVTVTKLKVTPLNSSIVSDFVGYILVSFPDFASDVAKGVFAAWLYDLIVKYNAKSTRINGREAANNESLARIIGEEIDIGKND